jgi:hypothetical protein
VQKLSSSKLADCGNRVSTYQTAADGYKNSFTHSEGFYQALIDINNFIASEGADWVQQELADWLNDVSQQGGGDDIGDDLSVVVHMNRINRNAKLYLIFKKWRLKKREHHAPFFIDVASPALLWLGGLDFFNVNFNIGTGL